MPDRVGTKVPMRWWSRWWLRLNAVLLDGLIACGGRRLRCLTAWLDRRRIAKYGEIAVGDDRFSLVLALHGRTVLFTPRYEEADHFLRCYVVPVIANLPGTFVHTSWNDHGPYTHEWIRYQDVEAVKLEAANQSDLATLRQRCDKLYDECVAALQSGEGWGHWKSPGGH